MSKTQRIRSRLAIVDTIAPAERLAAFRIATGVFALVYFVVRMPVFLALADRPASDFDGVGILSGSSRPPPDALVIAVLVVAVAAGTAFALGWRYRATGPLFALAALISTTLRGSWGQLLHFENLMVLQLLVIAFAPAADAWSLDDRADRHRLRSDDRHRLRTDDRHDDDESNSGSMRNAESVRYGWPLAVAGLVTVTTYVIAGIAKLRYGGVDWITGDTLRNHIAYSAARLDLIGGNPAPFAEFAVRYGWLLPVFAADAVVIELSAPMVWLGSRSRNGWVVAAWTMHVGIYLTMFVGFPSPLFGVAFAPFFALERLVPPVRERIGRWWPRHAAT